MLNAVSVGFIPLEWVETENGFDILKWELLEFSAVAVPANQDAIAEAVKSFGDEFAKGLVSTVSKTESVAPVAISETETTTEESSAVEQPAAPAAVPAVRSGSSVSPSVVPCLQPHPRKAPVSPPW